MQKLSAVLLFLLLPLMIMAKGDWKKNFVKGSPEIASMNAIAFGPEGILFVGDSKKATIHAIDTEDLKVPEELKQVSISGVDRMIADKLGSEVGKITIQDMAVNPISKKIYIAVHHENGKPFLFRLSSGEDLEWVALDNVSFTQKEIKSAVGKEEKDRRGRELRKWAISDLAFADGQLMLTGLSNSEFKSTFRKLAFPFSAPQNDASLEIYHAAHGRYETYAPIKAFTTAKVNGKNHLIAGYTCTPLVLFPVEQLADGKHVKGRTIAEMGSWNTPVDMLVMKKGDESVLLIANTNRAVMKVKFSDIESFEGELTKPVEERYGTEGVHFVNTPWVNVLHMAKLSDDQILLMKREANGELNLMSRGSRWF
ncbi:MAG: hypothetical protein MRZ79_07630 [Bacteroidia bacterium]|nr:hypothetical protein [Bacteroidia bacterium]